MNDLDWYDLCCLAKRTNSSKILDELSYHNGIPIQQVVAENSNTSISTLERLIDIPYCDVFWNCFHFPVIRNPSAPHYLKLYLYYEHAELFDSNTGYY